MKTKNPFTAPCQMEQFNTCNPWGFGGGVGTRFTFNEKVMAKIGIAYYRHLKPSKFITVYVGGERVFDEEYSKTHLDEADQLIWSVLLTTEEVGP